MTACPGQPWRRTFHGRGRPAGERITAYAITPGEVDLNIAGIRRRYTVHRVQTAEGTGVCVDGGGAATAFTEVPRFPLPDTAGHAGSLIAPTPGMVVRVLAAEGDRVTAGQPLVVLEAMKMEHTVTAPVAGAVTDLRVVAGQQVGTGQVIDTVEQDGAALPSSSGAPGQADDAR